MNSVIDYQALVKQHGSPLFVIDCNAIKNQYEKLQQALPNVAFHYAIKALPHPDVVKTLHKLNVGFDIASTGEIDILRKQFIWPQNTIHTHPIKSDEDIRKALRYGCTTFVIDNPIELEKFIPYRHRVNLLIRISFPSEDAVVELSKKFGCAPEDTLYLLQRARQLKLTVKGFSFHVGSQTLSPDAHVKAIHACNELFSQADAMGVILSVLDIGGGFPVSYLDEVTDIGDFCKPIREALQLLPSNVHVLAEPGRYLVANAAMTICQVIGKAKRNGQHWYYLNDGVYGCFSGQIYDHATYPISTLKDDSTKELATLAGPTCDSIDVIREDISLPNLEVSDIVIGKMMGAYTLASATQFNSLSVAKTVIFNDLGLQSKIPTLQYSEESA